MNIAVVGGGPSGLRAAEVAAENGAQVTVFDAKPSVGRKFLVAGRGGLNISKAEPNELFCERYRGPALPRDLMRELVHDFDPEALRSWAAGLGIETFVASTGRVYPREMKAAPLLRRWVERIRGRGVQFAMKHRLAGITAGHGITLHFDTPEGATRKTFDSAVLALGGASWPETGSDGAWVATLQEAGISVSPLEPANCGWEAEWDAEFLAVVEGAPLKNIRATAGEEAAAGELMITRYGLEGGAIYQLGAALRRMPEPAIVIDFKPALSVEQLVAKLGPIRRHFLAEAQQRWKLPPAAAAVVRFANGAAEFSSGEALARTVKACRVPLQRARPIAEAISTAGGVRWEELSPGLMLTGLPGVFVAGEMIDWEAPTGGYLMQGCFATGTRAGRSAAAWAAGQAAGSLTQPQ